MPCNVLKLAKNGRGSFRGTKMATNIGTFAEGGMGELSGREWAVRTSNAKKGARLCFMGEDRGDLT